MSTLPKHSGANDESKFTSVVHTEPDPFVSIYYILKCLRRVVDKASEPITAVMIG